MKKLIILILIILLLITACSPEGASEEDLQKTMTQVAEEIIKTETQSALDIFATQTANVPTQTLTPAPTETPAHTSTQTVTSTATHTPEPTLIPAMVATWDDLHTEEVCLNISQSFPQFDEEIDIQVDKLVKELLKAMEIKVKEGESDCKINLTINFEGRVFSTKYNSSSGEKQTCYSGADLNGFIRAETTDFPSIDLPFRKTYAPNLIMGSCATELTSEVGWSGAYGPAIVNGFAEIWGPSVAVAALKSSQSKVREAGVELVKTYGEEAAEAAPILIALLEEKSGGVAYTEIAGALGTIGPAAIQAVPVLIELYAREAENTYGQTHVYRTALERITGLEFENDDPQIWQTWWEMVNDPDIERITNTLLYAHTPEERQGAAELLGMLGSHNLDAIPGLTQALKDNSQDVRMAAARSLAIFGADAEEAVPNLVNIMRTSKKSAERRVMDKTLVAIGIEAIPELIILGGENTDNCGRYTNMSMDALETLESLTGETYDISMWGKDMPQVCSNIIEFLERCQVYYDTNS